MKITRVDARSVRIPIQKAPYDSEAAGTRFHADGKRSRTTPLRPEPVLEYVLIRIETDEGICGQGEAQADIGFFGETVEEVERAVADYLGPQLVGRDPLERERLVEIIDFRGNSCAKAGIDVALHDLVSRKLDTSVATLIGGAAKTRIPVALEIAAGPPDAMAAECVACMELGVRAFKPKIGQNARLDADRLHAIRQAVGHDVSIRADANQGYTPKEAIQLCRLVERRDVRLELLEQPVPAWDLEGMAFVRRAVDVPIEADESCYTINDAMRIVRHEAADVLNIKIGKAGGLLNAKKIAAIAEAAGLRVVLGTAFGLGLERAAKLHLAAATPAIVDAVEFTELRLHDPLLEPPHDALLSLPVEDGCLPVPTGPGLGVTLDEAAVERFRL